MDNTVDYSHDSESELTSDEEIVKGFDRLARLGVVEYFAPLDPEGERWVIGLNDRLKNLTKEKALSFLLGVTATEQFFAQRFGVYFDD